MHDPHGGEAHGNEHAPAAHGGGGRAPRPFSEKFILPLAIPIGAALVIFVVILSVSQILLALPSKASTPVAFAIALGILLVCAYLAYTPKLSRQTLYSFVGVPFVLLFAFGIFAGVYRQENPEKIEKGGAAAQVPAAPKDEITTDNKFSITAYTFEAGKQTKLTIKNDGQAIHNFDIMGVNDAATGNPIKSDPVPAGQSVTITFTIAAAGTYNFQCDFHPADMKGTVTVVPATTSAGAPGQSASTGGGLTETTTDNKFSDTTYTVDHGASVTLTVQNKGQAVHNWDVVGVNGADGKPVKTDFVPAGQSAPITFQIDTPGSYPFQCDVHPTEMKGTLVVK